MTKPFVIITAGAGFEEWGPEDVETRGLTGAEEVTVYLAEALARIGYRVCVVQGFTAGKPDRIVNGVRWAGTDYLLQHYKNDPTGEQTVLILSKFPNDIAQIPVILRHRKRIFWAHSIKFDDVTHETWRMFDLIVCATDWQTSAMVDRYTRNLVPTISIPYGINPPPSLPKVPGKCIYASSPDRGLLRLLRWWPSIKAARSALSLYVAYGRERMRNAAKRNETVAVQLSEIESLIDQPGIVDLGFQTKPEMDRHLGDSEFWLYPTDFEETGCLIGRKAVAAGAKPIYFRTGCLGEVMDPNPACGLGIEADLHGPIGMIYGIQHDSPPKSIRVDRWPEVAAAWDKILTLGG